MKNNFWAVGLTALIMEMEQKLMKFRLERVWCNTCLTRSYILVFGLPYQGIWVGLIEVLR